MSKTNKNITKPLFMWAGGKTKMIKFYQESGIMPDKVDTYIEPFFGGGAMFLHVMKTYNPSKVVINDINAELTNLYTAIKTDVGSFIATLNVLQARYLPLDKTKRKEYFYELREEYGSDYSKWTSTEESAHLYFLMKTAFNGIWQTTKASNGRFATPAGLLNQTDKVYEEDIVRQWHTLLQNATITNVDWRTVMQNNPEIPNTFYFLDPPYRGSFTSYSQTFNDTDQTDLVTFAKSVSNKSKVLLCNDDTGDSFFQNLQGELKIETYNLKHTAGRRKTNDDGSKEAKAVDEIVLHN